MVIINSQHSQCTGLQACAQVPIHTQADNTQKEEEEQKEEGGHGGTGGSLEVLKMWLDF